MATFENINKLLLCDVKNPQGRGIDYVNAVVVNGRAYTVGHMSAQPFRVLDTATNRQTLTKYANVDKRIDCGMLDMGFSGSSYQIADPEIDDKVRLNSVDYDPKNGSLMSRSLLGEIIGKYTLPNGYTEFALIVHNPDTNIRLTCGSAVVNNDGKLLGILNKASTDSDIVLFAPMIDVISFMECL
ncbi:hypothetical protein MCP_2161 [Methanocella paludicola SANAE]|uniref:Uncharacterized protein n=1 Tax=Methanocella paludicola (strain DSM 17711 / JCM 13418 / NBRC 101707 / SANAE) TaxID=304371 RepID=D1Z0L1_METPS|nr:hypothetical protein [Methanocella paludicola]BAI62233.1 hypothetical protein MCP_2161 [Methanocella paludicola SANAE]